MGCLVYLLGVSGAHIGGRRNREQGSRIEFLGAGFFAERLKT